MSEKLFSARRWKDPPIYRVVKVGGSKEDKIKGINWGLKNGVLTKEEYDQRMKEIEEEFKINNLRLKHLQKCRCFYFAKNEGNQ